jgi:hypothetical protein
MLVYGDATRQEAAADVLERVRAGLREAVRRRAGLARHAMLVAALVEAGALAQGVADAGFHAAGDVDRASPAGDAAMALVMALAARCARSWSSGFADAGEWPGAAIDRCAAHLPATCLEIRQPEGYAFYALYPESAWEAARRLRDGRSWQVIGVRSIGTSLAAMVATALGAPAPVTVRPVGHPFDRRVAADPALVDTQADAYAIVDEGPGLSGSSVAAVAQWLRQAGASDDRLHVFASHGHGPGPQARPAVRAFWDAVAVHVASFDEAVLDAAEPAQRLDAWVAAAIGPLRAPLREITGGAWRSLQWRSSGDLPPAHPHQERRKFIAETGDGRWLVKFAGLGRIGTKKLERARALAGAGFCPEPAGLCHGFLVERWRDDASPLSLPAAGAPRARLLRRIADYLAFRARSFPAPAESGASLEALHDMGRHNTAEALGADLAAVWGAWRPALASLAGQVHRVETDNRLHAWEWLLAGDTVLKTDALDHSSGHDLVGCQDVAWDVVGAAVELGLSADEEAQLAAHVSALAGRPVQPALAHFLRPCYLAFQLGAWTMAEAACPDRDEAARGGAARRRYGDALRQLLRAEAAARAPSLPERAIGACAATCGENLMATERRDSGPGGAPDDRPAESGRDEPGDAPPTDNGGPRQTGREPATSSLGSRTGALLGSQSERTGMQDGPPSGNSQGLAIDRPVDPATKAP